MIPVTRMCDCNFLHTCQTDCNTGLAFKKNTTNSMDIMPIAGACVNTTIEGNVPLLGYLLI